MKATHFRAHLFEVIEAVLDNGKPVDIELSGRVVELRPKTIPPGKKLARLVERTTLIVNPADDLLSAGWGSASWETNWDKLIACDVNPCTPPKRLRRSASPKPDDIARGPLKRK